MSHRTIILKGLPEREEGKVATGATIRPGDHVAVQADVVTPVEAPDMFDLGGAGNAQARTIAVEDDLQGKGVADSYTEDERIQVCQFTTGMEAAVRAGGAIAKGASVEAAANGEFVTLAAGVAVAVALEAATGADELVHVRFI